MNYFMMTKHRTLEENILYTAKVLYQCLEKPMHIDELFTKYYETQKKEININMEKTLFLSLVFLYSIGKLETVNHVIKKVK
ncbi:hypothetical protein KQ1_02046 [Bacillus cereus BAG3O-1]|uniref:ABC-three component system middle component 6 n=2 Tax=Bacillus cereus TaxID=1396 RepID=UPI0003300396|nr:hypothetical protein KQ1_02046 [Bacillus cereus BAG3O-1]PEE95569.1 hypothetical protein COM92_06680 [Bacillus cereus]PEW98291.1 hypothetical protein CN446_08255 [Bacillus cereus]PGN78694.1 hypothetical protein CN967_12460 [Bacillus cereus]